MSFFWKCRDPGWSSSLARPTTSRLKKLGIQYCKSFSNIEPVRRVESRYISCYDKYVTARKAQLTIRELQDLAEFRYQIRRFLRFSEDQARAHGIEPQQHQFLLAIKGLPDGVKPTIGELASRMLIRHHSTVELVNRLTEHGMVERVAAETDHREVLVRLTNKGKALLHTLSVAHHEELRAKGPELMKTLKGVLGGA